MVRLGARRRERLLTQLMFEQERLSCDPSHAIWVTEFGEGNEQMDRRDQHIAHQRQTHRPINTTLNLAVFPV